MILVRPRPVARSRTKTCIRAMLAVTFSLEGYLGVGFKGDLPMMVAAASLLIIGYLALGALMQLLVRDLATGPGLTSIIVSPAFGAAGAGVPHVWLEALP